MSGQKKESKAKARNFTFLLYPESIPENWEAKLIDLGVPIAVSPLHDQDKVEVDKNYEKRLRDEVFQAGFNGLISFGSQEEFEAYIKQRLDEARNSFKKPHYHVLYAAKNPVTAEAVRNKIKRALGDNALALVQIVDNLRGAYKYLTHESESAIAAGKHIYPSADIKHICGFDIDHLVTLGEHEKSDLRGYLLELIHRAGLENISQFWDYLKLVDYKPDADAPEFMNKDNVRKTIEEKTSIFRLAFEGEYYEAQKRGSSRIDWSTGEILDDPNTSETHNDR